MTARVFPIILSGGSGTRLWPLSRSRYPKQFIPNLTSGPHSLLGTTIQRFSRPDMFEAPTIISNAVHRFLVREELEKSETAARSILLEPVARNTAPAIAACALSVAAEDEDAILVVAPSDHAFQSREQLDHTLKQALTVAETGKLVLIGVAPSSPHTGYGYIRRGDALPDFSEFAFDVQRFVEKPDSDTAKEYLADGNYFWNSGVFVLHLRTFLSELERLKPNIVEAARLSLENAVQDLDFLRLDQEAFEQCENISIDYALMEKTEAAALVPLASGWSDVGSWSSLWDLAPGDEAGNVTYGDAILENVENCYVRSERGLIAGLGIKDLVVVDTPDALLVADRNRSEEISSVVSRLRSEGRREQELHIRSYRPWGYFETLSLNDRFQVKILSVKPGAKLSMQMHHHRYEHWVVVRGTAKVTIDNDEQLIRENEAVFIGATQWHRLENPGTIDLEVIEVQIGSYLGEDDIVRMEDVYNRNRDETD